MPDPGARDWCRPDLPEGLSGGAPRTILIHPDPMLRDRAQPAGILPGPELAQLAADLLATMYGAGGRGLAAPQIGVLRRIFVMDCGWKSGDPRPLVMLDPEIVARSDRMAVAAEQCLSIPDRPVEVARPEEVVITWYDLDGRHLRRSLDATAARIAQHELDHLHGRLILDYL
ncbi:peptide deformylase [Paracoccus spongiarum]|uniref:Peptide deformylase n=1 Tax=Paracoccus spongiarum TaxID=3064387 RepID=A0ABT9JBV7_9RHOB|nr:peptide deformylase [Paracoccus sp. 2205BS29-5]MDP5307296.1 peptide deformylase [Paracoccus sp. 2205BS29-5]